MANHGKLTDEQIDRMARWREAGRSYAWIAQRLGMSAAAIRWHCLRVGADHPNGHTFPVSKMPMVTTRGGHTVRRFTPDEDELILRRKNEGATNTQIARELGRKAHSVLGRLMTLGMHEDRRERA